MAVPEGTAPSSHHRALVSSSDRTAIRWRAAPSSSAGWNRKRRIGSLPGSSISCPSNVCLAPAIRSRKKETRAGLCWFATLRQISFKDWIAASRSCCAPASWSTWISISHASNDDGRNFTSRWMYGLAASQLPSSRSMIPATNRAGLGSGGLEAIMASNACSALWRLPSRSKAIA